MNIYLLTPARVLAASTLRQSEAFCASTRQPPAPNRRRLPRAYAADTVGGTHGS